MATRPAPAPRAGLTKQKAIWFENMASSQVSSWNIKQETQQQAEVEQDGTAAPSRLQDKKPPSVLPKTYKKIKLVGQPLPGMAHSNSLPESFGQNGKEAVTVQRNRGIEDDIQSLTVQCTNQNLVESKFGAQEKPHTTSQVLLTQQSLPGNLQQFRRSKAFSESSFSTLKQTFSQDHQDSQGNVDFMEWWESAKTWKGFESSGPEKFDAKAFTQKAENLKRALWVFDYLLAERGANLQGHIIELQEVADGIDKVHKGVKIAGITGGAAGALGVAAAVGGVILAPVTMGASLAVTVVGVGVAAAGGVTGASAAITNKVHTNMDRKKVETILKEHSIQIEEIERCVKFIGTHIVSLKKYDLSTLKGVDWNSLKMARMAHNFGDSVGAIGEVSKSSGMIEGLTLGLDMYFSKEDSKELKKGSETKFAKQIRKVAKQMQASLDELMKFKTMVASEDM
ncbi:apolipoprotein L1 isoform X1 [Ictalurus punctatus]|uniref:Apolipoprotein L1 isoform X1 n=1 Tax=Ictalurus punctatus TaxID=7998 RepID=A0A2D0S5G8_ICTPU|nr:apolipoprotein L1 isoform X1 [Ictalurus punctatus]